MVEAESRIAIGDTLLRALQCSSTFPAAFLVSLSSLVLYTRARLNSWPVAHINDPKDLGISYVIFYLLTLGLFLGSLITAFFMPQRRPGVRSLRPTVPWSILAFVLWALLILVVKWDPGGYIEWTFD